MRYVDTRSELRVEVLEGTGLQASDLENHLRMCQDRFPRHLPLASLVYYSPYCLRRLRSLIKGRPAYIVPGVPHWQVRRPALPDSFPFHPLLQITSSRTLNATYFKADGLTFASLLPGLQDRKLAELLSVPLLAPSPAVLQEYTGKTIHKLCMPQSSPVTQTLHSCQSL